MNTDTSSSHLQDYIHQFAHLHTDTNRHRWSESTHHRAPHKPLLLLSILVLFAKGPLQTNLIEITPEQGTIFAKYWQILIPPDHRGNMALPYFHMRSSRFWHLVPAPGKEALLEGTRQVDTLSQLQKLVMGASLDDELFHLIQIEEARNALRAALIQTYFSLDYHAALLQQGAVNIQSFLYSQELLGKM